MTQKIQPKTPPPRKTRSSTASVIMTMLKVRGNPSKALKDLTIPNGAEVAIISKSGEIIKKLRQRGKISFGSIQKIKVRPVSQTKKTQGPIINQAAFEPDARSLAILEGVRIAQEDLREAGGAYDLEQVRVLMRGVSRQAIDKRVQEGSLLAVPGPSNRRSYPTLQFNQDGTVVDGLRAVCEALPTTNPWTIVNFFAQPDDRLNGRKPIDVLKQGDVGLVVEAARRMGQQGA
ncbi:hypothetical protein [Bradyrhizobium erythrophlei]|uniref:Antitoxin Xre/MbcA/ParS-like toxin-binding domain-containing protein n=1 Tax=Bradyrhizobium erythrophlei TaxID=1437360 RepID=A0A1M7UMS6_9BRAD|nr:hypothetical protein [Bradyrhizobium erythrophlei]SHN84258.1 hypothetical protein SAMN05444170_5833 [Bradyrhizobium erythrophlei]